MFYFVVILSVLISDIQGQIAFKGTCPDIHAQKNFDLKRYMGMWYTQAHYPEGFGPRSRCYNVEYKMFSNGLLKVKYSKIHLKSGRKKSIHTRLSPDGTSNEAKFWMESNFEDVNPPRPLLILETDYESYAVAWSCGELRSKTNPMNMRYLWLMTRVRNPSQAIMRKMYNVLNKYKLGQEDLENTDNKDCD